MSEGRPASVISGTPSARQLVEHLNRLVEQQELGALALLRRGLGQQPGEVPEIYAHVLPYLQLDERASQAERERLEDAALLMASLYALWHQGKPTPSAAKGVSLGKAFAQLKLDSGNTEHRFVALLKANRDRLPDHLRHAITLLKSKDIALDWTLLFQAIALWDGSKRQASHPIRRWARDFWEAQTALESAAENEPGAGGEDTTEVAELDEGDEEVDEEDE